MQEFREAVEKLRDNIYVDDLATEEESITEVKKSKPDSISLFREGGVKLSKWHPTKTVLKTKDQCILPNWVSRSNNKEQDLTEQNYHEYFGLTKAIHLS